MKVDVQACFDTIDQDRLLTILEKIVREASINPSELIDHIVTVQQESYVVQSYAQVVPRDGRVTKEFIKRAYADGGEHSVSISFVRSIVHLY